MKISKKAAVLAVTYISAGFLILSGFIIQGNANAANYRRKITVNYNHAFSELATAVEELDITLKKAKYASSPAMLSAVCAQAYANAMSADAALSSLPYGNIELEHTAAFLAKTGDYAYFLSKSSAAGNQCSQDTREILCSLSESASLVSDTLSGLYARLIAGNVSIAELKEAEAQISSQENSIVDNGLAGSFKQMESEFPQLPTLIYDGPFSEHIENAVPLYLDGMEDITEPEAEEIARKFTGADTGNFTVHYLREGDEIPVFVVTHESGSETLTFEVSQKGGQVIYYGTSRMPGTPIIKPEEGVKIAEQFLKQHGYKDMGSTYWSQEAGELVVNFAWEQDGIIYYPDLIKVYVSLDTGSVRGFESLGYAMCHTNRDLPESLISEEQAKQAVSCGVKIISHNVAVIPTSGKNEVLCHEFLCEDDSGGKCLIYINAETGGEEKILLLLESENGTLTI